MALAAINITIGQSLGDGAYSSVIKGASVPNISAVTTDATTVATDLAAVVADDATLVADGATPTQAHVTTLDGHVTTLNTDYTALNTAITALAAAIVGDVSIIWNGATVTHRNQLRAALRKALEAAAAGYGGLAE